MNLGARCALVTILIWFARTGAAQSWEFDQTLDVAQASGKSIFHHLESSGRRNIALSGATISVVWEDDRDGTPRIYLARKHIEATNFDAAIRISDDGESYEPSLAPLTGGRVVVAWETDEHVYARIVSDKELGPVIKLSDSEERQANVSAFDGRVYLLRSQREGPHFRIRLSILRIAGALDLVSEADCAVDSAQLQDDQFYPVSAIVTGELIAAWEDRRPGHTIIMASASMLDDACRFQPPARVSEPSSEPKSSYGKGHGAARVTLARFGGSRVLAVWADKRKYWEGYDIYAAAYVGDGRFGVNQKVQDEFGDFARQWHPAAAGNAGGRMVVAWSDEREGHSEVMLSFAEDGHWSEDIPLAAGSPTQQAHPSIVMDADGNLHVAWVDRAQSNGPTRLLYRFGRAVED